MPQQLNISIIIFTVDEYGTLFLPKMDAYVYLVLLGSYQPVTGIHQSNYNNHDDAQFKSSTIIVTTSIRRVK